MKKLIEIIEGIFDVEDIADSPITLEDAFNIIVQEKKAPGFYSLQVRNDGSPGKLFVNYIYEYYLSCTKTENNPEVGTWHITYIDQIYRRKKHRDQYKICFIRHNGKSWDVIDILVDEGECDLRMYYSPTVPVDKLMKIPKSDQKFLDKFFNQNKR